MAQEKDSAFRRFLEKPEHFCDLFNGALFRGEQVLKPFMLSGAEKEKMLQVLDTQGRKHTVRRYQDVVRRVSGQFQYAVYCVEGQGESHYAMPVREMLYDALNYSEQVKQFAESHREKKDCRNSAQFLSGMLPKDRLAPVLSICIYYGQETWTGPRELQDMLNIPAEFTKMSPFLANYKLNLIQASEVEPSDFRTDWRFIFSLLSLSGDGEKMKRYIEEHKEECSRVAEETFDFLCEILKVGKWWSRRRSTEEGVVDMCLAFEQIEKMAEDRGRKIGEKQGVLKGEKRGEKRGENQFAALTEKLLTASRTEDLLRAAKDREYRKKLYKEYSIQ